jgi:hypothetical protein
MPITQRCDSLYCAKNCAVGAASVPERPLMLILNAYLFVKFDSIEIKLLTVPK